MEVLIIGSIAPIILIYLKSAFAERCTVDGQLIPSPTSPATLHPPEFPDFMSAFGGTVLRIGIENLWPQERESCAYSVNWTAFNARLCGSDPFDLDSFCRNLSVTSAAAPTPTTPPENRSTSSATITDVEKRFHAITTISKANAGAPSLARSTQDQDGIVPPGTTAPEPFQSDVASDSHVPVLPSVRPDSGLYQSPPSQLSSLASPVDSSSFAATGALSGSGSDTHVTIGVTCCIAFLVVCVILFVVLFSKNRLCKCKGVRRSVLKIVQRQRSDVQPLSTSSPSHPSTPLQAMYSNPLTTTNNNVAETSDVEASTGNSLTKRIDGFRSAVDLEIPDDT